MMGRIFVTGAAGFVGSALVNRLAGSSEVVALVRKTQQPPRRGLTYIEGDVCNAESFSRHMDGCDTVFHCAARISFDRRDFSSAYDVNVAGTRNILEAALRAGVGKFVHLSACAVLGFSKSPNVILDESADPEIGKGNVYACTKKLAEGEVLKFVGMGLNASIANSATVYGPGDRSLNSGAIIKAIYEERMKWVPPGGTSFVAVDDLTDGLLLLAEKGRPGERYIFCSENMEYRILAERIAAALDVPAPCRMLPRASYIPALLASMLAGLVARRSGSRINLMTPQIVREAYGYKYFSSRKARRELGWKPAQSLEDAVKRAFDYYIENKLIRKSG